MDFLIDCDRKERRYRLKTLLVSGDHYQIALVEDTDDNNRLYCAKTIAYDPELVDDISHVQQRREAMNLDYEFTKEFVKWTPEPKEWIQIEETETSLENEPVLVVEYLSGRTLEQIVEVEGPIEPERARVICHELALFLKACHDKGWIFRTLHPSHVIVAADNSIAIVGTGNATPKGKPPNLSRRIIEKGYMAPEIREEVGGTTLLPPADLYTLGALLSFILTGEHPRAVVENPLTEEAYQHLSNLKPEGISLIVAKCMAPMAKNRLPTIDELLPFLEKDSLPTPTTPGFGMVLLPAPWSGAEPPDSNRAVNSKLSSGPLISVPHNDNSEHPGDILQDHTRSTQQRLSAAQQKKHYLFYTFVLASIIIFAMVIIAIFVD